MERRQLERFITATIAISCFVALSCIFALSPITGQARSIVLTILACSGALVYAYYWRISYAVHTLEPGYVPYHDEGDDRKRILTRAADIYDKIDPLQALIFFGAIVEPRRFFERITETVELLVRTLIVRTSLTLVLPIEVSSQDFALPLILQRRGQLLDGLQIFDSNGVRISSIGRDEAVALQMAILRLLITGRRSDAESNYFEKIERHLLELIIADAPNQDAKVDGVLRLIKRAPQALDDPEDAIRKRQARKIIRRLRFRYPLMVMAQCRHPQHLSRHGACRQRFTIQQRSFSALVESETGGRFSWIYRTRDRIRRLMGIRPASIALPLHNATRCGSYHVQIAGPVGTYVARQNIVDTEGKQPESSGYISMRRRLGQRSSHLYLRSAPLEFESCYFKCDYFERMPGSVGPAAISALAASVLIVIAALIRLGFSTDHSNTDIVAAVLSFPAVAGGWIGLRSESNIFGGVLSARFSILITFVISLTASVYFVTGPHSAKARMPFWQLSAVRGGPFWTILAAISVINVSACIGAWLLRANVEAHFVKQDPESLPSERTNS